MFSRSREDDKTILFNDKLYSWEDAEGQPRRSAGSNKIGELLSKNKWESKLLSPLFWNKMIVISCVIAISLDPLFLFLYIPFTDEGKKCLGMDIKLRNVALILRSLTDITFLVDIGYQIYEGMKKAYKKINERKDLQATLRRDEIIPFAVILARELKRGSLVTDLLSVFPLPQLLVVKVFFKMRGPGYFEWRKIVNFFLFGQYLSRIYRIIFSYKKISRSTGIWIKVLFNLFLYLLASHVLGAFWYFFSIQRETFCWHQACDNHEDRDGCMNVPDNTKPPFNYGIFLDSLKIGNTGHIHFPTKLCYSFWWGLRNLSNFGTNLTTSNYVWENLFAILISTTGLLLFVYLVGNNVQRFIQIITTKYEESKKRAEFRKEKLYTWMEQHAVPDDLQKEIMKNINIHCEEDRDDAPLETAFNALPSYTQKNLKHFLCFKILRKVELLQLMNDSVLKMMCDYLTPVTYAVDHVIFPKEHLIDRMLLIIEGTVLTCSRTPIPSLTSGEETRKDSGAAPSPPMAIRQLGKGDVYGEELLTWASPKKTGIDNLPTSNEYVKCHTKVEAFALSAQDLLKLVSKSEQLWRLNLGP